MSEHRRKFPILGVVALSATITLAALAQGPDASPGAGAPRAQITSFGARGAEWAWIRSRGEIGELFLGSGGSQGRKVAEGSGWAEVAVGNAALWLLQREGQQGRLLRVAKSAAGDPEEVAGPLAQPGGLHAEGDRVFWIESVPAAEPGLAFIPTLSGQLRLRMLEASGAVRTLAEWPSSGAIQPPDLEVIGVMGDRVYTSAFNGLGTEFMSVRLSGEPPTRVAAEAGSQHGTIHSGRFVWTAPSDEATPVSGIRQLRVLREDAASEVLADWVPAGGALVPMRDRLYYAGLGKLFTVREQAGTPDFVRVIDYGPVATDGRSLVSIVGDAPVVQAF